MWVVLGMSLNAILYLECTYSLKVAIGIPMPKESHYYYFTLAFSLLNLDLSVEDMLLFRYDLE